MGAPDEHLVGIVGTIPWLGCCRDSYKFEQVRLRSHLPGRPPDLLGSRFIENIILGRLQFMGRNVDIEGGGEINPGVELLEGHSPPS